MAVTGGLIPAASAQNRDFNPFAGSGSGAGSTGTSGSGRDAGLITSGEFVDTPVTDVLRVISDLTGWSILMSPAVTQSPPKVNIWAKDLSPEELLDQVIDLSGLILHREGETRHVMTFDEYALRFGVERKVIKLQHVAAAEAAKVLDPFLRGSEAAVVVPSGPGNQLVILAPEPLLAELERLVGHVDVEYEQDSIKVIRLQHLDAQAVVPVLQQFLVSSASSVFSGDAAGVSRDVRVDSPEPAGGGDAGTPPAAGSGGDGAPAAPASGEADEKRRAGESLLVRFMVEPSLNAVVLRGVPSDVRRAASLLRELDVESPTEVVGYELEYTDPEEAFETIERLLFGEASGGRSWRGGAGGAPGEAGATPRFQIAVSPQNRRIVVDGPADIQANVRRIIEAVDQPLPAGAGEIRIHRLENATAEEVVAVLESLLEADDSETSASRDAGPPGPGPIPVVTGARDPQNPTSIPAISGRGSTDVSQAVTLGGNDLLASAVTLIPPRVTAAAEINAVVVRASASEHETLAAVIADLDRPREQVMLEVTLVNVTTDDEFRLGVEVAGASFGSVGSIGLTSFGIGAVDTATGEVSLAQNAPFGLNVSVFNGADISLVLNALETIGDTRITSAPKLLVADNSIGTISQVDEEPFAVASQGEASTITSFGGFVEAGTSVSVTPYISRDDWLRLDYEIELSTFGQRSQEQLAANLPPPRSVNNTTGTARIPDGYVVALGGLVSKRTDEIIDQVPFLGSIPGIGALFRNQFENDEFSTLFIFIRPVILRDPDFQDLLLLSRDDTRAAELETDEFPVNPLKFLEPASFNAPTREGP